MIHKQENRDRILNFLKEEGGKTFLVVKTLITGSLRGQLLEETIRIVEEEFLRRFECALPENKSLYREKEAFARELIRDLKTYL
jgi:uncharacterized protein